MSGAGPAEMKVSRTGPAEMKESWTGPTLRGAREALILGGALVMLTLGGTREVLTLGGTLERSALVMLLAIQFRGQKHNVEVAVNEHLRRFWEPIGQRLGIYWGFCGRMPPEKKRCREGSRDSLILR